MGELEYFRNKLNTIDEDITKLLKKRMDLAINIGDYKIKNNINVEDKAREDEVVSLVLKNLSDERLNEYIIDIYKYIFTKSKEVQNDLLKK